VVSPVGSLSDRCFGVRREVLADLLGEDGRLAMAVKGAGRRVEVSGEGRAELERIVRAVSSEVRMVERARIVLGAAEGRTAVEIAGEVGCSLPTVVKWRGRYARYGLEGLRDAPRSGRRLTHGPEVRALLIAKACTRPLATAEGQQRERWTYRELGAEVGMSESQAHVILSRAEIKPHRTDYWMMSDFSRPEFEQRCGEVCGLYLNPPENVLVVSLDEKTSIQAKAPTKPDRPPAPGKPARREHEYTRNGTQCLFAALKVHYGEVLAMASKTRNRYDLIRFLDLLDAEIPTVKGQQIVAISDNLSTRGTQEVQDWLATHPRWRFQFTPIHASWLNQIEIVFSILYRRLLKHGIFTSEEDLAQQMLAFVETYNQTAKPFAWTYTGKTLNA
jgi:transposase